MRILLLKCKIMNILNQEVTYILNQNGVIVQVVRPGKIKDQGYDKLNKDGRVDFIITVSGDLMSIKDQIIDVASQIINLQ